MSVRCNKIFIPSFSPEVFRYPCFGYECSNLSKGIYVLWFETEILSGIQLCSLKFFTVISKVCTWCKLVFCFQSVGSLKFFRIWIVLFESELTEDL